jgi:hypothetical protein
VRRQAGAERALDDARTTWTQLPGFMRRRQLAWRIRAFFV